MENFCYKQIHKPIRCDRAGALVNGAGIYGTTDKVFRILLITAVNRTIQGFLCDVTNKPDMTFEAI